MEVELPFPVDLVEAVPQPQQISEHDEDAEKRQDPKQYAAVADPFHIEEEVGVLEVRDRRPENEDVDDIDERQDEAQEGRKDGERPLFVEKDVIKDEEEGRKEVIGHIPDIPPITCFERGVEKKDDDEEGDEDHDHRHELKGVQFAVIALSFAVFDLFHRVGKHNNGDGKNEVIAEIGVVLEEAPRKFVPAVDADIEDPEREQAGKRRNDA